MKKLRDCIEETIEFPSDVILNGVPMDGMFGYVSSVYCNGIVNYLSNKRAYMLCRYHYQSKNPSIDMIGETYTEKDISNIDEYSLYLSSVKGCNALCGSHTDYSEVPHDDIVISGETKDSYVMIWFDNDVSDCSLIRVSKEHYESLDEFNEAVYDYCTKDIGCYTTELSKPSGFIHV